MTTTMTTAKIRQILGKRGLKVTPQRAVIMEFMMGTKSHPTAEEIYEAVKDALPGLSKGTLYNVLNALVDANILSTVVLEPGAIRYDANVSNHHHFIDVDTGQIYDIPWDRVQNLFNAPGEGFCVADYQVTFYGVMAQNSPKRPKPEHP